MIYFTKCLIQIQTLTTTMNSCMVAPHVRFYTAAMIISTELYYELSACNLFTEIFIFTCYLYIDSNG